MGKGGVLNYLITNFDLSVEFSDVYSKRYENSLNLIEMIINFGKQNNSDEFYISHLAINELFSAIRDELRSIILFKNGIPISRWRDGRNNPDIKSSDYESVYKIILESFDILFENQAIVPIHEKSLEDDPNYLEIYSSILFLIKIAKTQDSTLLTTAILNKADYFVTKDEPLIKSAKKLFNDNYGVELISPAHAMQLLKKRG